MRIHPLMTGLLVLPLGVLGCAQPWGVRKTAGDDVKTVASVGDRPLPVRSGTPGDRVSSSEGEPLSPPPGRGRISGRVFDERGKPVANASVRLAVGGAAGGKAVSALTDRSGAFTLRGLRPGSTYLVIADYEGPGGLMSGRAEAEAPDANVRISLNARRPAADEPRTSVRPARPGVEQVSNSEEGEEAEESDRTEPEGPSPPPNREDVEPPAPEADRIGAALPAPSELNPSRGERPARGPSWSRPRATEKRDGTPPGGPERSERSQDRSPSPSPSDEENEVNPLPPALESEDAGASAAPAEDRDDPVMLARAEQPWPSERKPSGTRRPRAAARADDRTDEPQGADDAPQPLPSGILPGARTANPDAYAPLSIGEPDDPPARPARPSRKRPAGDPDAPSRKATDARARPTWGELTFMREPIPLDESIRRTSRDAAPKPVVAGAAEGLAAAEPAAPSGRPRSALLAARTAVSCDYDSAERRVRDFVLPDAEGRMVALRDFDSDLVLLDFWGTWCGPCRKSIPHLIEIQKTLGGKKVQVIGVACERSPAAARGAKVAETVRRLKINYPVLVTGMDGKCPVQDALQIQFYPTLILLDRQGRILRREQGATDETLARLDRFILRNLRQAPALDEPALQARVARSRP